MNVVVFPQQQPKHTFEEFVKPLKSMESVNQDKILRIPLEWINYTGGDKWIIQRNIYQELDDLAS